MFPGERVTRTKRFVWDTGTGKILFLMGLFLLCPGFLRAGDVFVTSERAEKQDDGYRMQGAYHGSFRDHNSADIQVLHLTDNRYAAFLYTDGLPGSDVPVKVRSLGRAKGTAEALVFRKEDLTVRVTRGEITLHSTGKNVGSMKPVKHSSPTIGREPPDGAVPLYNGSASSLQHWENAARSENGYLKPGTRTRDAFGDFTLHLEFRIPYVTGSFPSAQNRGNSGVYIFNRYEIQLLDSFGLPYQHMKADRWNELFRRHLGFSPRSDRTQWCGALYGFRAPSKNMSYPPLLWQTYDVTFRAPRWQGGEKVEKARITVQHNGVTIHDDVRLPHGTGRGKQLDEVPRGPIVLQDHGNPVRFRNIWIHEP